MTMDIEAAFAPTIGVWYHLAITRQSGVVRLFVNGASLTLDLNSNPTATLPDVGAVVSVGKQTGSISAWLNGYMQDVQVTKGIARWTANFAPPVRPYGN